MERELVCEDMERVLQNRHLQHIDAGQFSKILFNCPISILNWILNVHVSRQLAALRYKSVFVYNCMKMIFA
jgi:hypothetical protein